MHTDHQAVEQTLAAARQRLLAERTPAGHWEGELSSSALSTATAVCALAVLGRARRTREWSELVRRGFAWLAEHQNRDGAWGDTADSPSNISTTALCWAALGADERPDEMDATVGRAEDWLRRRAGGLAAAQLARAIAGVYGKDRTFSTPILTMCALAGRFGAGRRAWQNVPALPFELAACPHTWFRRLGLPVVSYALPALVAIGLVRHQHRPTRNPLTRLLRNLARGRTLRVLESIQPTSGGFLEAPPLTSFVVMSLAAAGQENHPVVERGCAFLVASVRADGSWPIDTNLATWLTTLSIDTLAGGENPSVHLTADERPALLAWLLGQQFRQEHPYTHATPGGWAWTDLPGGVPDADDTAGALIALRHLTVRDSRRATPDEQVRRAVAAGVRWLLDLQNRDGGIPTFCRGWGKLPFDRSAPDLTAHALRAWHAWRDDVTDELHDRIKRATHQAVRYLISAQRADGAWTPLWFGNQHAANQENPLYGTTRVLRAEPAVSVDGALGNDWSRALQRGVDWLLAAQHADGGWGAAAGVPASIEETALAVEALAAVAGADRQSIVTSIERGGGWLVEHTAGGTRFDPTPIGLYFARLWYHERLYPLIFTVAALQSARRHRHHDVAGPPGPRTPRRILGSDTPAGR